MNVVISVVLACYDMTNHKSKEECLVKEIKEGEMGIVPENGDIIILENRLETKVRVKTFNFEYDEIILKLEPIFFRDMNECIKKIKELKDQGW